MGQAWARLPGRNKVLGGKLGNFKTPDYGRIPPPFQAKWWGGGRKLQLKFVEGGRIRPGERFRKAGIFQEANSPFRIKPVDTRGWGKSRKYSTFRI